MSLSIGIVGLTNVGKSSLFNALTKAGTARTVNYPFSTVEPNKATVPVVDTRLYQIAKLVKPRKFTYAAVDFVDISGLVKGASQGEGLGNQFLANIRECAVILHIVRCFEDPNIVHVHNTIDPLRDIETVETELLLADIQTVERRLERLQKQAKGDKLVKSKAEELVKLLAHMNSGLPASQFKMQDDAEFAQRRELALLTDKSIIYCANVDDAHVNEDNEHVRAMREFCAQRKAELVIICARLEEELQDLPEEDQMEILRSYNIRESGLMQVIGKGYRALGLISYFTAGEKEARAWTIKKGFLAPQAAGVIHSDFERGFIRAEVIAFEDFIKLGSEAACRTRGLLRVEGKAYTVKDGDVIHFLFNV
jgi:GTP-binding protein YchF